ncbi:MAG: FAD-binding oxidoreductase [Anaerolineae bacterium]|nr:FAD-binding oxidoreductase [Anaerolineae bacterium]MDW8068954.1 FAD-binding oxidoreductase [Anaerolineae bacterium]
MDIPNLRWWGWGTLDRSYSLENRPRFWPTLRAWLGLPDDLTERPPVPLESIQLRPSRLDDPVLASLRRLVGEEAVRLDQRARVEHACGKGYRDLVRVRAGYIPNPPDAVVYPADEGQVAAIVAWAADRDILIIPFGGGSTVTGAVEPPPDNRPAISLDLARLDRLVSIDPVSRTARIQAGATGPEVEAQLNAHGFTLGHFPLSFEFSTLGGWIATRGAGQASAGYGKIEHMTQAVQVVTPMGIIETRDVPASATGPSLLDILVGSEGACGVITQATMRICPRPEVQDYRGFLFQHLDNAIAALRDLMQEGPCPTIACLSDPEEAAGLAALAPAYSGLQALIDRAMDRYLTWVGHRMTRGSGLLLLGYDGRPEDVRSRWRRAIPICRDHGGLPLGRGVGESWKRERFALPYLRDTLLSVGILVDTLETATTWSNLLHLYEAMTAAIRAAIRDTGGGPGYVMTRVTHSSPWGAALCTTFLGRQVPGAEIEQWWAVKEAATEAILTAGGTLSHHYGSGRDHARWLREEVGPLGLKTLQAIKATLDPTGIMNPGVLLPLPTPGDRS